MNDESDGHSESSLAEEVSEMWSALKPLLRRLPNVKKSLDKLTGGLAGAGIQALVSRLRLYRTGNLAQEAQKVADASGLPLPTVFNTLVRQRNIDELTLDAIRRVTQSEDEHKDKAKDTEEKFGHTSSKWFHTFYDEASTADEAEVREAFIRILAGEIQTPSSFSIRTLHVLGSMSQTTAQHFTRAASVSVRLTPVGTHIVDARIPALGGSLGKNCLAHEGLSYSVLSDLTENGALMH